MDSGVCINERELLLASSTHCSSPFSYIFQGREPQPTYKLIKISVLLAWRLEAKIDEALRCKVKGNIHTITKTDFLDHY